jgi:hypothetical protein
MIVKSYNHGIAKINTSVKVEEPKKEIPQPIVEGVEEEKIEDPDDGEGEG